MTAACRVPAIRKLTNGTCIQALMATMLSDPNEPWAPDTLKEVQLLDSYVSQAIASRDAAID